MMPARTITKPRGALILLAALLSVAGCTRAVNRAAERRIRDALPDVLGPAKEYRVHVANPPLQTVEGRLSEVTIDGDDVQLPGGLLVDLLHLDLRDVDLDIRKHSVRSIGRAQFTANFGEAALDEYMADKLAGDSTLRKPRVQFGAGNRVTLSAERITLGIGIPFRVTGPVRVEGPTYIEMDPRRLTVIGIPITGRPLDMLKSRFEHGLDLSRLPFPLTLESVQTTPGHLTLSGSADVAAVLQKAQTQRP